MQTKEEFEAARKRILELNAQDGYMQWLGIEFLDFEQDYIKTRMPAKECFLNNFGSIHGGVLYSLADITAGTLSCAHGRFTPTVDGHMNYLEAAMVKEYVTCEARLVRYGSHLVSMNVEIKNEEGKLLDNGCFTFYRTESRVVR